MKAVVDIETNGLINYVTGEFPTVIHCIVVKNTATSKVYKFYGEDIELTFPLLAKDIELWIGHNFLSYDAVVLRELLGIDIPDDRIYDTLLM